MNRLTGRRCITAAITGLLAAPGSAWGISGLEVRDSVHSSDRISYKVETAYCPPGKRVVGGGGAVFDASVPRMRVATLTGLQPIRRADGRRDAYVARAAETVAGTNAVWSLTAYAVCADGVGLGPWSIRRKQSVTSSSSVKAVAARCPPGRRVFGTGVRISKPRGRVVIQVARTSRPGDLARAQAHEAAGGTHANWSVTAYAICGVAPTGFVIPPFDKSTPLGELPNDSNSEVIASRTCPDGKSVIGAGGAVSRDAPGNVSLTVISPGRNQAQSIAVENAPTPVKWGFAVASASCAPS